MTMEINLSTTVSGDSPGSDWDVLLRSLEQLTKLCQDSEYRMKLPQSHFPALCRIMEMMLSGDLRNDILTEGFRFLRNSVVTCKSNQDFIREETKLFEATDCILQRIVEMKAASVPVSDVGEAVDSLILAVRCALQFLANSIVDNPTSSVVVCSRFSELLGSLCNTFRTDDKVIQYAAMIAHLGLKQSPQAMCIDAIFLRSLLDSLHLEFVVYAMESLVLQAKFYGIYEDSEASERIKMLSFLNERPELYERLDEKVVVLLKTNFIERSDFILRSKIDDRDNLFCWEIAVLLEVLCSLSSTEIHSLKSDAVLLTTVSCLLRQIDAAGKAANGSENVFSPVEDLAKLTSKSTDNQDDDDIRAHPTFQFKAHLIRLIGNLAHRSIVNQDKVRDLECLPIILDNCKIDARNPFIAQWSILAIRNLCEGNEVNQAYVREVQRIDTETLIPKLQLVEIDKET